MDKHEAGGAIAQLGERLLCKQDVVGSIPSGSTIFLPGNWLETVRCITETNETNYVAEKESKFGCVDTAKCPRPDLWTS